MAMQRISIQPSDVKPEDKPEDKTAEVKKDPKIWVNVGMFIKFGYEGEAPEGTFITLPFNLALDRMEDAKVPSRGFMKKIALSSNNLKKTLLETAETIKPGEGAILNDFKVELRVVGDDAENTADEDDLSGVFSQIAKGASSITRR